MAKKSTRRADGDGEADGDGSEDTASELKRLRAENAALKSGVKPFELRVSAKGGLSVYGLGRFPVTLYKEQWLRILGKKKTIIAFIEENDDALKAKS